jgi:hypothetical protein
MMSASIIFHVQSGLIFLIWAIFFSEVSISGSLLADDKSENVMSSALSAPVGQKDRFCVGFPCNQVAYGREVASCRFEFF